MNIRHRLELFVRDPIAFFSQDETKAEIDVVNGAVQATARCFLEGKSDDDSLAIKDGISGVGSLFQGMSFFFAIADLVQSVKKVISAVKPISRIKAIFRAVVSTGEIVSAVAGAITKLPIVSQVLYPVSFVDGALQVYQTHKNVKFYEQMKGRVKVLSGTVSEAEKREHIMNAVRFVHEKSTKIEKKLGLDREAKIQEKAQAILQSGDVKRAEGFIEVIRDRANSKLGLNIAKTALKIAAIVTTGLLLFMLPNPVTLALAAVVALVGFGLLIADRITNEVAYKRLVTV